MSLYRCLTLEMSQFLRQEVLNPIFTSFDSGVYETRIESVGIAYIIIPLAIGVADRSRCRREPRRATRLEIVVADTWR